MTSVSFYYLTPSTSSCPSGPVTSSLLIVSQQLQPVSAFVVSCSKSGCCSVPRRSLLLLHRDHPLTAPGCCSPSVRTQRRSCHGAVGAVSGSLLLRSLWPPQLLPHGYEPPCSLPIKLSPFL